MRRIMKSILFPEYCPVCFEPVVPRGRMLHKECEKRVRFINPPICIKCGSPVRDSEEVYCSSCNRRQLFFDMGRITFPYRSSIQKALKEVKTNGTEEFVEFFGRTSAMRHRDFIKATAPKAIVPVPLHLEKRWYRGFNQAELLAEVIAKETGIPMVPLLKKERRTKDQKTLSGEKRWENLRGAFKTTVPKDGNIPEKVLLVDDVYTTGSTINACAYALKQAGVKEVFFLCIATGTAES